VADAVSVDRLGPGDHACMTFSDAHERLDLIARFVRDGLRGRQRVLCLTDQVAPEHLAHELAARSVRPGAAAQRGQLRIAPASAFLLGRKPVATDMVQILADEIERASRDGYDGVRVTADMCWATRPAAPAEQLTEFEEQLHDLFTDGRLCVICQYDRDRFDAVTLAFAASTHPKVVAAQVFHESVLLRICRQYSPPGIRVAGELDYRHRAELEQALAESGQLDRHMHVNLTQLDYIDAACAAVIMQTATRLPASHRMTINCQSLVGRVLDLVGVRVSDRVRVVVRND
jgi:anti-anti-sigma factor